MNLFLKQFLIIALIILAILGIIFGAVLPLNKAQLSIKALQSSGTFEDFEKNFSQALDFYSPTGQEESVKYLSNFTLGILSGQENLPKPLAEGLLNFNLKYFEPIIQSAGGGNFSQNFLFIGQLYQTIGLRFNDSSYLKKAVDYYKKGLELSPRRPEFLYNLFNIYLFQKDFVSAKKIGQEILEYWPNDDRIKARFQELK